MSMGEAGWNHGARLTSQRVGRFAFGGNMSVASAGGQVAFLRWPGRELTGGRLAAA
jgi:hypothetical protein